MIGFVGNIEEQTLANNYFRQVIYTGQHAQLVVMSLLPNEDIGMEVHKTTDQFLRIEKGEGKVIMNGEESLIKDGSAIVVPAGTQHNVINTSSVNPLKLYTVYSPPHHKDGTIHKTKQDAQADTQDHL
jgi:mannose-6-phosphate isomerase-like protein (cupin superfamily)